MWLKTVFDSSVGKKLLMAATGLFFCLFLVAHLIGNLMIYGGKDAFNTYAEHLHSLGPLLNAAEILMVIFAVIHIVTGIRLFLENRAARPVRYQVNKNGGGRTAGSATMPYTGIFILVFVLLHLAKFHFADHGSLSIYEVVQQAFASKPVLIFYVVAMIVVAVHVSHGFWSAFQSFGLNHEKYSPGIRVAGICFSIAVGAGFGFIPVWIGFLI